MKNEINVLHIDTERGWRGGQQQAAYLVKKMVEMGFHTAVVCKPRSKFHSFCQREKIPHYPIAMRNELDFVSGFKIASLCRKFKFEILHLHSAHALSLGLWAKLFYKRLKLIAVRRVVFPIKKNPISQFKYKNHHLERIVSISDGIKRVLIEDGVPENKIVTIKSGVDLGRFNSVSPPEDFRKSLKIPDGDILVGTIAAITGEKGYPNLIRAAKVVLGRAENVTFLAVGGGSDEEEVRNLAEKLNLGGKFIFAGFREDIGNFLKSFDIFVLASKMEGLGTSVLDAQTVGLPIVATTAGGIPEMIVDGRNGFLVPPEDEASLADAILRLIGDGRLRQKLGENAKREVKRFSIDKTIRDNIELYRKILG